MQNNEQLLGYIKAKVEDIEKQIACFQRNLNQHLEEEMIKFDIMKKEIEKLNNWKLQITTLSSSIGIIIGFVINKLL